MLTARDVWKYYGGKPVLRGISLRVNAGETLGIVGPSGGGKSVLLKVLGDVVPPDRGEIEHETKRDGPQVGFLFQEGALFDSMTVLDNVAFPLLVSHDRNDVVSIGRREAYERAHAMLGEVGLSDAYRKIPGQLSGGMRRRVGLARALVADPAIVLLDDPSGGLDPVAASVIMNLIRELQDRHRPTVVIVSHDIRRLLPSVTRVVALFEGSVVCDVPTAELQRSAPAEVIRFLSTRYDFSAAA